MVLKLHYHPLSSYCHKAMIALAEKQIGWEPALVDLGNPESAAAFHALWPLGKLPVLEDTDRGETVMESSIIIEYLDQRFDGARLLPDSAEAALKVRFWDRLFDQHVHTPMQKIVTDRIRPEGKSDAFGVEQAHRQIRTAYGVIEKQLAGREWIASDGFSMADCAAAPALFYAGVAEPMGDAFPLIADYRERLMKRPSYREILLAAEPHFIYFPLPQKPDLSILK